MDNYKRLGDYIRLDDVRNGDNTVSNLEMCNSSVESKHQSELDNLPFFKISIFA